MKYTPEEKQKMDKVMAAFADYVAQSKEIDIAYSDKSGYVRLIIDDGADPVFFLMESCDDLLQMFYFDIFCDMVYDARRINPELCLETMDFCAVRTRLLTYLDDLGEDREHACFQLEVFLRKAARGPYLP